MVVIKKGAPPRSLVEFQKREGASYDSVDFPRKDVYDALLQEQGGLCAYCMARITKNNIQIEHWIPQKGENYPDFTQEQCDKLAIDYRNMLGVCPGGAGRAYKYTTCDEHRKNLRITIDPRQQRMIDSLQYGRDGTITSTDERLERDISEILNLNEARLVANRHSAWEACKKDMQKRQKNGTWTKATISKQIAYYEGRNEDGNRHPYAGIVLYWLKKRLQSAP